MSSILDVATLCFVKRCASRKNAALVAISVVLC
jgi:hypothetical protein